MFEVVVEELWMKCLAGAGEQLFLELVNMLLTRELEVPLECLEEGEEEEEYEEKEGFTIGAYYLKSVWVLSDKHATIGKACEYIALLFWCLEF